jgi:ketosteroid isomerase-like protein
MEPGHNEEAARRVFEAFNAADLDAVLRIFDEAVEVEFPELLETQRLSGHDGIRAVWRLQREPWDNPRIEVEEAIESGNDIILLLRMRARGKASGVELEQPRGVVFTFGNSRIVRARFLTDHSKALAAAGLNSEKSPRTTSL